MCIRKKVPMSSDKKKICIVSLISDDFNLQKAQLSATTLKEGERDVD